jgi:chromate transporter
MSAFLDAVNVAAVALIISVCISMIRDAVTDWRTTVILLLGLISVWGFKKLNAVWVVLGGALIGYILQWMP